MLRHASYVAPLKWNSVSHFSPDLKEMPDTTPRFSRERLESFITSALQSVGLPQ